MKVIAISNVDGDWTATYDENGKMLTNGHSVDWRHLIEALGIEYDQYEIDYEAVNLCQGPSEITNSMLIHYFEESKRRLVEGHTGSKEAKWYSRAIQYYNYSIAHLNTKSAFDKE
jgi:hypothetical protein